MLSNQRAAAEWVQSEGHNVRKTEPTATLLAQVGIRAPSRRQCAGPARSHPCRVSDLAERGRDDQHRPAQARGCDRVHARWLRSEALIAGAGYFTVSNPSEANMRAFTDWLYHVVRERRACEAMALDPLNAAPPQNRRWFVQDETPGRDEVDEKSG